MVYLVSDAGFANRKLWTELEIYGEKGSLENNIVYPMDTKRKI